MSDKKNKKAEEIELTSQKTTQAENSVTENASEVAEELIIDESTIPDSEDLKTESEPVKIDVVAEEVVSEIKTPKSKKAKKEAPDSDKPAKDIVVEHKDSLPEEEEVVSEIKIPKSKKAKKEAPDSDKPAKDIAVQHEDTLHVEEEVSSSDDDEHDDENTEEKAQKDYHVLTPKELISELKILLNTKSIQHLKHDVEEIRTEFNAKFQDELAHEKEEFMSNGGNIIDFHYTSPDKREFNSLYFDYKEKRNEHYKNLKKDLQANFLRRNELIEELKGLLNAEENINTTYKHFKEIQEKWHVAGAIPRDKYNIVWNTYHHHVENFYDFLHLNREFRDLDFKHNLEQKLKLISRADELTNEPDINKAFRELQMLHKMWKEEIGPVAKKYRDEVWDKFSEATKVIHDKRFENQKEQESLYVANYEAKKELITQISEVVSTVKPSHQGWQNAIKKIQELRDAYFETGKVPRTKNKEIWKAFKESTRDFNLAKNNFYKNLKKEQYVNLEKKQELIKIADENKDSDDFEVVTPLMKKIQSDWRVIGHVPRKDSDKIWKQFKAACNHYFDRLHSQKNEANKEELAHFDAKKQMLDDLKNFELSEDHKVDLKSIKQNITEWKKIGRVPYNKKNIEQDFNKVLDGLFGKLNLGKKETELIKFENKLNTMVSREDDRVLQNEQFFISKKIEESKNEIRQLENNLGFFKHVDSKNPMVKEVHSNIERHKEQLEVWKAKLSKIRSVRQA